MPTSPPEPIRKLKNNTEKMAREMAIDFIDRLDVAIYEYSYATRSHMPNKVDFTDFINSSNMVFNFCRARPDWTVEILARAFELKGKKLNRLAKTSSKLARFAYGWQKWMKAIGL